MNEQINTTTTPTNVTALPPEGNHAAIRGMTAFLNAFLDLNTAIGNLFGSLNSAETNLAGMMQAMGQNQATQLDRWMGNNKEGDFTTWTDNSATDAPDCPGLQYWIVNNESDDKFGPLMQGMQAHIQNLQSTFQQQTSAMQTKVDLTKDGSTSVESAGTSLLQSLVSSVIAAKQNENSIRIN